MLGTGGMGRAMGGRLLEQGHEVVVWDRTREAAEGVDGATVADDPAAAVRDAEVVLTVLRDGDAVAEVAARFLPALPDRAVWVQASTVGVEAADRLREQAGDAGDRLLDAPVSGSTQPAAQGQLGWLVAGPDAALETARPVLEALGHVTHVGTGSAGSRLKLAVNTWMTAATVAFAESLVACDRLGVDRQAFLGVLSGGPLGMPYLAQKAELIAQGDYPAGFPVELALKDVELSEAAGAHGIPTLEHVATVLRRARDAGHGREDLASVVEVVP